MKSTLTYKTVRAKEIEDLDQRVNDALADGFQLHGGPYGTVDGWICQALIRETDRPAKAGYQYEPKNS